MLATVLNAVALQDAPDVPRPHDHRELHAAGPYGRQLARDRGDRLRVLTVGALTQQGLTRELDQHAVKGPAAVGGWGGFAHLSRIERDRGPVRNSQPRQAPRS
jgi:hypothetical protein